MSDFEINDESDRKTIKFLDNPVVYSLTEMFGITAKNSNYKVLLLSSGLPIHNDLEKFADFENFCDSGKSPEDKIGQSTLISGMLKGNNSKTINGFCNKCELFFAKVIDNKSNVNISSVIAGILWGIIQGVNIIVIPFTIDKYDDTLNDTIKKATDDEIVIISLYGKSKSPHGSYDNMIKFKYSEGKLIDEWSLKQNSNMISILSPKNYEPFSMCGSSRFMRVSDNEAAAAFGTALTLYGVERCNSKGIEVNNKNITNFICED